jgi:hypothetical protein
MSDLATAFTSAAVARCLAAERGDRREGIAKTIQCLRGARLKAISDDGVSILRHHVFGFGTACFVGVIQRRR